MALATAAAIATIIGAGASVAAPFFQDTSAARRQAGLAQQGVNDARSNMDYLRLLNTIGLQRSSAGTEDSEGSRTWYDQDTNTWRSKLGELPAAVQAATERASISRNTTDLYNQQAVNAAAIQRANQAAPGIQAARMQLENFRPSSAADLTSALTRQTVDATNRTNQPIIADLLRNAARTGTASSAQLEALQRGNADSIRKSIIDSTIAGKTGVGQMNSAAIAPLVQKYAALGSGATAGTPQLQYTQLDTQNPNNILATLMSDRAKTAGTAPFMGAQGLSYGQYGVNQATKEAISAQTKDPFAENLLSGVKQFSNLLKDPDVMNLIGGGSVSKATGKITDSGVQKSGMLDSSLGGGSSQRNWYDNPGGLGRSNSYF